MYELRIGFFCALILLGVVAVAAVSADTDAAGYTSLDAIVVTAEKRTERLQDVPVPVSVVSAQELTQSNRLKFQDYYTQIPSLNIETGIQSAQMINIRGLSASTFVIDDVPIVGFLPDIDPGSLARVEVLRGPQGTLHGANSLGGLIKFVTADPSTVGVTGRVDAGAETVYNGYDLGYNLRGAVNLPVSQDFALRASVFTRQDAGYIDNPILHIDGINRAVAHGGQLTGLWQPMEGLSIRLNVLYQDIKGGNPDTTLYDGLTLQPLSGLQQSYVAGTGPYERKTSAYDVVIKDKIFGLDLTSVTGYTINSAHDYFDDSPPLTHSPRPTTGLRASRFSTLSAVPTLHKSCGCPVLLVTLSIGCWVGTTRIRKCCLSKTSWPLTPLRAWRRAHCCSSGRRNPSPNTRHSRI